MPSAFSPIRAQTQALILPRIDTARCTACGWCVLLCPTHAVTLVNACAEITHPADCSFCDVCETFCPEEAIQRPFSVEFEQK